MITRAEAHAYGIDNGDLAAEYHDIINQIYDGVEHRIAELEKPKTCNTCSVQDDILRHDPQATFDKFGCTAHEGQLCRHKFEWADGSISACYLPFGHEGQCNGTVCGSKCYFPKEYSSQEETIKAEWELPQC